MCGWWRKGSSGAEKKCHRVYLQSFFKSPSLTHKEDGNLNVQIGKRWENSEALIQAAQKLHFTWFNRFYNTPLDTGLSVTLVTILDSNVNVKIILKFTL